MFSNYIRNYLQGSNEEEVIEDTLAQWELDQQNRQQDLISFVDEFIQSEEYEDYLASKRKLTKVNAATNYARSDFAKQCNNDTTETEKEYPFTVYSKKMFAFIRRFRQYINNEKNLDIHLRQMRGIQIIKDKIEEFKKSTILYGEDLRKRKRKVFDDLLNEFCETFHVDWTKIELKNRKTKERIASFCVMLRTRYVNRKKKYARIAKLITEEIKHDKRAKLGTLYKIEKNEWTVNDLEIVGVAFKDQRIKSRPFKLEPLKLKENSCDWSWLSSAEMFKKHISEQSDHSDPNNVSKKEKIGKHLKKHNEMDETVVPIPRIKNYRKKLTTMEGIKNMSDLIKEFQKFDEIMEMHYLACAPKKLREYALDECFLCKPEVIMFNNYEAGKTYKRTLKIQNVSYETRKFRHSNITTEDAYDALLFRLTPLIGIQKVATGQSVIMCLIFTPEIDAFTLDATLEFISFDRETQSHQKFFVDVKCVPKMIDFTISSNDIYFGQVPLWQKKSGYKTITLSNNGHVPCRAVIKKIKDPLNLEDAQDDATSYTSTEQALIIIQEILEELLDNLSNHFEFDSTCVNLPKTTTRILRIQMKNFQYLGDYLEKHVVEVYDYEHNFIGNHEILLHGEVIGHFIRTRPEEIDFGFCLYNSVYQAPLEVENTSSNTQAIAIKFPSALTEHFRSNVTNIFLSPGCSRTVWLKLFPRKTILKCPYFKPELSILEFPVYVYVLTNNYTDVAPVKIMAYAIVTSSNSLNIIPCNNKFTRYCADGVFLNIGHCTVYETVTTDVVLENNSLAPQVYGFVDLPKCLTITPNYGFGLIPSGTKKTLTLHFHPDYQDLLKKFNEEKSKDFTMKFKISFDTLCNIRQSIKKLDTKKLRKTISLMIKELRKPQNKQLQQDIRYCQQTIKIVLFPCTEFAPALDADQIQIPEQNSNINVEEEYGEDGEIYNYSPEGNYMNITLEAKVVKPLIEVSAQYIVLPDTPCSSYSVIDFEIKALRMEFKEETPFLKNKDLKLPKYEAWYKITGDNKQIRVEPSCGILKNGDSKKIFLIFKPTPPDDLVVEIAKSIKYAEIYKMRMEEFEEIKKVDVKTKIKDKKNIKIPKKGRKTSKASTLSTSQQSRVISKDKDLESLAKIIITESELVLSPQDYFPAEMCYWRSLQPYTINSKLTCLINYESKSMSRKKERIYLDVVCKAVRPDFILIDMKSQRLNFGNVIVGTRGVQYVMLQNIKYDPITIKASILNPIGPFRIPYIKSYEVPPECYLKLPIYFEPTDVDKQIEEYLEISSGSTVVPLIIKGTGSACGLLFYPEFTVCRLSEATIKYCDECSFKLENTSEGPLTVTIEKVFEIEGALKRHEIDDLFKELSDKKSNFAKEKKVKGAESPLKFSNELIETEINLFSHFHRSRVPHFEILTESHKMILEPNSFTTVIIGFGLESGLNQRREEINHKRLVGRVRGISRSNTGDSTYHVAKYDCKIRNTFIKDFIFVGSFK